ASAVVGTSASGHPEVVEGSTLKLQVTTADDVQVSDVQLLVPGQPVQHAVSFPFNLSTVLPTITQNGSTTVTVQVLATDTGGNVSTPSVLTLDLVPDTTPPQLLASSPADGATEAQGLRRIELQFSKPLNKTTVTADTFKLTYSTGK